tara:strand:+ start:245494 stop:245979 length:486 start_codon:yes stop_codon:yes gene_type:complete
MKGTQSIIDALNDVLTAELTAINQYFLHARMLQDWGLEKLGKHEYDASIDEMKHADELIKRILFLEGLPNLQKLGKLRIGQNIKEILDCDLAVEMEAIPRLKDHIELCEKERDYVTRDLFRSILESEEHHVDWLETQLSLLSKVGEQNYLQSQMDPDKSPE